MPELLPTVLHHEDWTVRNASDGATGIRLARAGVITHGVWRDAVEPPGLGAELLDGITMRGAAAFEAWLLSERRRLATATEAVLYEAALGWLSRGDLETVHGFAVRAAALSPLDENHQALLIRLCRLAGWRRASPGRSTRRA